jgi:CheY-like chemotaxis protein
MVISKRVDIDMLGGVRVLIVEDNAALRLDLQELLDMEGYEVFTAADGRDAVKIVSAHHVQIVVSDYEMPNMNGLMLLEYIRSRKQTAHQPFILISGGTPPGVNDDPDFYFLRKPFAISDLISAMEQLLLRQQATNQRAAD